jgi:hypothetical protein
LTVVESLQSLVLRRAAEIGGREGPLSVRQLEDRCEGRVSRGVFQQIMAGTYDARVGQRVLDGLATALDVDLEVVEQSAGAPPSFGPFRLSEDAARLTPAQRKAVKHVVQAMIDTNATLPAAQRLRAVASGQRGPEAAEEGPARARQRRRQMEQEK